MEKPKTVRLQINVDLSPMGTEGQILEVPVSCTGILKVKYWRRRLKDAETDKCVEILEKGDPGFVAKAAAKAEAEAKKAEAEKEAEAKKEKAKAKAKAKAN